MIQTLCIRETYCAQQAPWCSASNSFRTHTAFACSPVVELVFGDFLGKGRNGPEAQSSMFCAALPTSVSISIYLIVFVFFTAFSICRISLSTSFEICFCCAKCQRSPRGQRTIKSFSSFVTEVNPATLPYLTVCARSTLQRRICKGTVH